MRYRTTDAGVGEAAAEVADVFPGNILWFDPRQVHSYSDNAGARNHPVLILCRAGSSSGNSKAGKKTKRRNEEVTILLITTLKGKLLQQRFPTPRNELRRKYLPIRREPPAPHPDNGVLLELQTTGNPPFGQRQSYVKLEPLVVDITALQRLRDRNTANLTAEAFNIVVEHLERRWRERKIGLLPGDRTYESLKVAVVRRPSSLPSLCAAATATNSKRSGSAPPVSAGTAAASHMHSSRSGSRGTSRVIIPMGPGNPGIYSPARSPNVNLVNYPSSLHSNSSLPTRIPLLPPLPPPPYQHSPLPSSSTLPRHTHIYRSYGTTAVPSRPRSPVAVKRAPSISIHNITNGYYDAGYRYATITERGQLKSSYHAQTRSRCGLCCGLFLSLLNILFLLVVLVGFGIWVVGMFRHVRGT